MFLYKLARGKQENILMTWIQRRERVQFVAFVFAWKPFIMREESETTVSTAYLSLQGFSRPTLELGELASHIISYHSSRILSSIQVPYPLHSTWGLGHLPTKSKRSKSSTVTRREAPIYLFTTTIKRIMAVSHSFLSPQYIHGIYIPSGLLLVGIAIVKKEWLPYAVAVAIVLGSWKIYSNRQLDFFL